MKLKKLLAAVTAAALAVTTMAVTSFTASAATPIYSVTLEASGEKNYSIPISGVDMSAVASVEVNFKTTDMSINGGGGYNTSSGWVSIADQFSCAADGTAVWTIDTSSNTPTGDIQVQLWCISGAGKAEITSVVFKDSDASVVKTIDAPYSIEVSKKETGSTSVTPVDGIDYTKTAKIEVDISSSTSKGTNGKIGVNKNSDGGWSDSGNLSVTDAAEAWTNTWICQGLDGCDPSSLQVQFYSIDIGQILSVNAIRFYDSEGNELKAAAEPAYTLKPSTEEITIGDDNAVTFTLEGYDGTEPPTWEIDETYAEISTAGVDRNQCKVIGKAVTDSAIPLTVKLGGKTAGTAMITVVDGVVMPPAAETVEIAFPTGVIELTVKENEWDGQDPHALFAQADISVESSPMLSKTYGDLKNTTLKVTGAKFDNCSLKNIGAGDVSVVIFTQWGTGYEHWKPANQIALDSKNITYDLSTITGVPDDAPLMSFGIQLQILDASAFTGMKVGDTVKINDDSSTPPTPPVTGDKTFEGEVTFTCSGWWGQKDIPIAELIGTLDPTKTTVVFTGEFSQVAYNSIAGGSKWSQFPVSNGTYTLDVSDVLIGDDTVVQVALSKESGDATVSWVATEKGNKPDEPDQPDQPDPPTPPVTTDAIWEGTQDFGNWADTPVEIEAEKFSSVNANDTIKFTYSINAVPGEAWNQIKIADGNDTVLASPTGKNEWGCVDLSSATTYSFEISAADLALVKANGMKLTGHGVVLAKVEKVSGGGNPPVDPGHTHTPATAWTSDATGHWHACTCDEKFDFAAHTFNAGTITTPATETTAGVKTYTCTVCSYSKTETIPATGVTPSPAPGTPSHNYTGGVVVPVINNGSNSKTPSISGDNGKSGWDAIISEIAASGDGAKVVVDMNGATKVPSSIMREIEGLDIDLVLNMGRGTKWTINGLSVTGHKNIDFGVSKNTRHIPGEVVSTVDGTYKRQISLDHNGTFGCTAALTVDVGTKYNGLYANLFYYNPKTESLELTDCSLISGGNAKFMFTHASDYLITVTAEPLGEFEDVSSAAGIASDNNSIGNGIAVSAVLAAIVLSFGIVVYRKRRHN